MEKNEPTQSKYDAALAKYNTQLDDAEIAAQAARIIAEKVPANNTPCDYKCNNTNNPAKTCPF